MIYLHGYGVTKETFEEVMQVIADQGVAAVSLPAPLGINKTTRRSKWEKSMDVVHAYVRMTLDHLAMDGRFDTSKAHLIGASEGATHATFLVAMYPEAYGGVIAVSPAGAGEYPAEFANRRGRHPLYLVYDNSDHSGVQRSVREIKSLWENAGQRVYERVNSAGPSSNWQIRLAGTVQQLVRSS
jgi:pimeloyl-ACP methyl ester carboxylesterase